MSELIISLLSTLGGSALGGVAAYFNKKQEAQQKLKEREFDLLELEKNHAFELSMAQLGNTAKLEQMESDQKSAIITGEYQGLIASIEADKATYSVGSDSKWLIAADFIRGTMRPLLTGALMVYLGLAVVYITLKYNVQLDKNQVYDLLYAIVMCLVSGASVALAWWFGSRNPNKIGG